MATFRLDSSSKLVVKARSSVHDTNTTWSKVSGSVTLDIADLQNAPAANASVDMTVFDAGDWLKNRKLRSDFDFDKHPTATFALSRLSNVVKTGDQFTATAHGTLAWRGKQVDIAINGKGAVQNGKLQATGAFPLDIRLLGLSAPRVLMFKVDDEVTVEISLNGSAA